MICWSKTSCAHELMVGGLFEGVVNVTETLMPLKMFHISFLILICFYHGGVIFVSVGWIAGFQM